MTEPSPGCVFCGGKPLSREHVVPEWARRLVAVDAPVTSTRDILGREGRFRDGWATGRSLEVVVRKVCRACNNGWMADLERRAAPLLAPMIASPSATGRLSARDIDLISVWITKTVLVADLVTRVDGIEVIRLGSITGSTSIKRGSRIRLDGSARTTSMVAPLTRCPERIKVPSDRALSERSGTSARWSS
jgi:hypothetical protein